MPSEPMAVTDAARTDAARTELRAWITRRGADPGPGGLSDHSALFEQRILRSIHVPELILLIERLSGEPVDVEDLSAGDFRDLDTIIERFFAGAVVAQSAG